MALRSITLSSVSRVSSTTWNAVLIIEPTQGLCFCIGNVPGLCQELCLFCVGIVAQWIDGDKHGTVRHSTICHGMSRFQPANHNVAISHFNDQRWHGVDFSGSCGPFHHVASLPHDFLPNLSIG
jgi:hypothetical protein